MQHEGCGQLEMTQATRDRIVGVDIGGTKIAAGIVDCKGEISAQIRTPMVADRDAADALAAVLSAINSLLANAPESQHSITGIGICAPGPLDPKTGIVINPPNLRCWRNFPLAAEIEKAYRVPVKIENDANAAALAESYWGAGRGYQHIFYTSLGTGIGTGLVFDGKIYNGRTGAAAEGGHMSIDYRGPLCGCGKPGCIEILAAGPAIARRARAKLTADKNLPSIMLDLSNGVIDSVTGEMVGKAYAAGDPLAKQVLLETVELLSLWLSNIVDLLEPDVIIIGGGVADMLIPFFEEIGNGIAKYCIISRSREIPMLKAHYGEDAGIAGGAALCLESAPAA
jgi:glucokinase